MKRTNGIFRSSKLLLSMLLTVLTSFGAMALNADVLKCSNLFDSSNLPSNQPENPWRRFVTANPLPTPLLQLLQSSQAAANLQAKYARGKGLKFNIQNLDKDSRYESSTDETWMKGELIYANYFAKIIAQIFPEAKLKPSDLSEGNDQENFIFLRDGAEKGMGSGAESSGYKSFFDIAMIKKVYSSAIPESKQSVRQFLGIPDSYRVVSLYFDVVGLRSSYKLKIEGHGLLQTEYDGGPELTPSYQALTAAVTRHLQPEITFLSFGQRNKNLFAASLNEDFTKNFDQILLLSEVIKNNIPLNSGARILVVNDTLGKMSAIARASDIHIVRGPINLFDGISNGTPTVSFNNDLTIGDYNKSMFQHIVSLALGTNGFINIEKMSELNSAIDSQIHASSSIVPQYQANNAEGFNLFMYYLSQWVEAHIDNFKENRKPKLDLLLEDFTRRLDARQAAAKQNQ